MIQWLFVALVVSISFTSSAQAQFDDLKFKQALKLKKDFYLSNGSFSGGDRSSSDFTVSNVRVAANPSGYDRVVIDLAGITRPPFYLVEVDPIDKRVLVTLYGKPKLDFSTSSSIHSAKKARSIQELEFIPITEKDRWTWVIHTRKAPKAEVFELTQPARIIVDLK